IRLGIVVDGFLVGHDDRILALLHVVLVRAGLPLDVVGVLEVLVLLLEVVDLGLRGLDLLVERSDLLSLFERRIQRSEEGEEDDGDDDEEHAGAPGHPATAHFGGGIGFDDRFRASTRGGFARSRFRGASSGLARNHASFLCDWGSGKDVATSPSLPCPRSPREDFDPMACSIPTADFVAARPARPASRTVGGTPSRERRLLQPLRHPTPWVTSPRVPAGCFVATGAGWAQALAEHPRNDTQAAEPDKQISTQLSTIQASCIVL